MTNSDIKIKFGRVDENKDLPLPQYESKFASGMDLRASLGESSVRLNPGERKLIPTGFRISIPHGYEAQVRPRSGLALKHGITMLNTPGTIDSDYRGEIKVIAINLGNETFTIRHGDRIAQLVISPVIHAFVEEVTSLEETERGERGFGSTGVN